MWWSIAYVMGGWGGWELEKMPRQSTIAVFITLHSGTVLTNYNLCLYVRRPSHIIFLKCKCTYRLQCCWKGLWRSNAHVTSVRRQCRRCHIIAIAFESSCILQKHLLPTLLLMKGVTVSCAACEKTAWQLLSQIKSANYLQSTSVVERVKGTWDNMRVYMRTVRHDIAVSNHHIKCNITYSLFRRFDDMGVVVKAKLTAGGCVHEKTKPNKNIFFTHPAKVLTVYNSIVEGCGVQQRLHVRNHATHKNPPFESSCKRQKKNSQSIDFFKSMVVNSTSVGRNTTTISVESFCYLQSSATSKR